MNLLGLALRLLPTVIDLLPAEPGAGRHLAVRLSLRAGLLLATGSLATLAMLAAIAAMLMGLAEVIGYPAALGVSAIVLLIAAATAAATLVLLDRRADQRAAEARAASLQAMMAPLVQVGRRIDRQPIQTAVLALALGAAIGFLRRR